MKKKLFSINGKLKNVNYTHTVFNVFSIHTYFFPIMLTEKCEHVANIIWIKRIFKDLSTWISERFLPNLITLRITDLKTVFFSTILRLHLLIRELSTSISTLTNYSKSRHIIKIPHHRGMLLDQVNCYLFEGTLLTIFTLYKQQRMFIRKINLCFLYNGKFHQSCF